MSGKLLTAVAAAIVLAVTGLASAQTVAPRHNGQKSDPYSRTYRGYYNVAPGFAVPTRRASASINCVPS